MALQYLTHINLNKNELQLPVIHKLSAAPSNPVEGQIYYHDTDDTIYLYTSAGWTDLGGDITSINITAGNGLTGTVNTTNGAMSPWPRPTEAAPNRGVLFLKETTISS